MNNLKIGLELKKLVFKRSKGPGEHNYVIVATGKEVEGKNEVLELLREDLESWELLGVLRLKNETEDAFFKKIKKQITLVLFEDQYNLASGKPTKRKTEKDKEQCVDVKESGVDKTEEIEEVKDNKWPTQLNLSLRQRMRMLQILNLQTSECFTWQRFLLPQRRSRSLTRRMTSHKHRMSYQKYPQ